MSEKINTAVRWFEKLPVVVQAYQTDKELYIDTLEGKMKASVGDFIITGVHGEQYPCKPDIFWETYREIGKPSQQETLSELVLRVLGQA